MFRTSLEPETKNEFLVERVFAFHNSVVGLEVRGIVVRVFILISGNFLDTSRDGVGID